MKHLTPDEEDVMRKALLRSVKIVAHQAAARCATEQECGWQPWCRIEGRCKRVVPARRTPE